MHSGKLLLILDLDETLIHATDKKLDAEPDFRVFHYHVYKRPYLNEFLLSCAEHFDLAIWSSASDDYVQEIVNGIIPKSIDLKFIWGRSRCTPKLPHYGFEDVYSHGFGHYAYTKQIKKIKRKGYRLERTLIVDDTPSKVSNSYGNAIYIKEFKGEQDDLELEFLINYLITLYTSENVRRIEKRFWRSAISKKS